MQKLQDLVIELGGLSQGELNQAIFMHSEFGLLEAIARAYGRPRAEKILGKIAERLGIRLLDDRLVKFESSTPILDAVTTERLVTKYRAIPMFDSSGDAPVYDLVLADPLNRGAIAAFSQAYGQPRSICLAREHAISRAILAKSSELEAAARREVQDDNETSMSNVLRYVEQTEVRKALQQVTATSVKHRVKMVEIFLDEPFVRATFSFEENSNSQVEISLSPYAFLAGLLRRGQVTSRSSEGFTAQCRVEFKSSSVNFNLEMFTAKSGGSAIRLSEFDIDSPDDPNFWLSISESEASLVRAMLDGQCGLSVAAVSQVDRRALVSKAIMSSYPDIEIIEDLDNSVPIEFLLARAEVQRVLLLKPFQSVVDTLESMQQIPLESRSLLKGVFAYAQIPRLCEVCAEDADVPADLSDAMRGSGALFREAVGCEACDGKSFLGVKGVVSIADLNSGLGDVYRASNSTNAIIEHLIKIQFKDLYQSAEAAALRGWTVFEIIAEILKPTPSLRQRLKNRAPEDHEYADHVEAIDFDDFESDGDEVDLPNASANGSHPITGSSVFLRTRVDDIRSNGKKQELHVNGGKEKARVNGNGFVSHDKRSRAETLLLIIDDDPDQRLILRKVFELAGYQVEVAADGIDGVVSAARLEPNLILMDYLMPHQDGLATIGKLKQNPNTADIPIVAFTACEDSEVEFKLLEAGVDDFCPKSVSRKVLLKRIERLVE
jgi:CheY-like chemotaxis protein